MSGECYFPFESLHCIFVCLFYFIFISQHSLCIRHSEMILRGVKCFVFINCMHSGSFLLAYYGTPNTTLILVLQAKQNAHQICLLLFTSTSTRLLVSSYHFSSVRQYGGNTTNTVILLIFINTERLKCTHWQVCVYQHSFGMTQCTATKMVHHVRKKEIKQLPLYHL